METKKLSELKTNLAIAICDHLYYYEDIGHIDHKLTSEECLEIHEAAMEKISNDDIFQEKVDRLFRTIMYFVNNYVKPTTVVISYTNYNSYSDEVGKIQYTCPNCNYTKIQSKIKKCPQCDSKIKWVHKNDV